MTDDVTDERAGALVGELFGRDCEGGGVDKAARVVVRPQKGFDFGAQRLVARAGSVQE